MRAALLVCALIGSACRPDAPPAPPKLADALEFGDVGVDGERILPLPITGLAVTEADLRVGEPFFALPPRPLHPGEPPRVAFRPTELLEYDEVLTIEHGGLALRTRLHGFGVRAATCRARPCESATLTPDRLSCVREPLPNGASCTDTCVAFGTCHAGACRGSARNCDDHQACTVDRCDPRTGCVHVPVCQDPANPCLHAFCRADGTCDARPLADGDLCGETPDDLTHRCRANACLSEPSWAANGDCELHTPPPLTPTWAFDLGGGARGVAVDEQGRFVTIDCYEEACALVALDALGRLRRHLELGESDTRRVLVAGGLYLAVSRYRVVAFDADSLAEEWRLDVAGEFGRRTHGRVEKVARATPTTLAVLVADEGDNLGPGADPVDGLLLRVDLASGQVLQRESAPREFQLVSDGAGTLVSTSWSTMEDELIARTPAGKWRLFEEPGFSLVITGGTLLQPGNAAALALDSGRQRFLLPGLHAMVSSDALAFGMFYDRSTEQRSLTAFDPSTGTPLATCTVGLPPRLFATARRSVLAVFDVQPRPLAVREFFADGTIRSIGSLVGVPSASDATVSDGYLVVVGGRDRHATLFAYPLPAGLELAQHGWVMDGGNPSRDFTPR